jgi:hypothetical protein
MSPTRAKPAEPLSSARKALARSAYTLKMDDDSRAVLIAQIATFGGFKSVTSILIIYFFPSWEAVLVVLGLSVPWIVAAIWYFGIVSHVKLRLLRVRAKRKQLLHQEWNVD